MTLVNQQALPKNEAVKSLQTAFKDPAKIEGRDGENSYFEKKLDGYYDDMVFVGKTIMLQEPAQVSSDNPRVQELKDSFKQLYPKTASSRSQGSKNLLEMAAASFKVALILMEMRWLNVSEAEIESLKKQAMKEAASQYFNTLRDNMKTEVMMAFSGSSKANKKKIALLHAIEKELATQLNNFGEDVSPKKLMEMRIEVAQEVKAQLLAEKSLLVYQQELTGDSDGECAKKIARLDVYIAKTEARLNKAQRGLEVINKKEAQAGRGEVKTGIIRGKLYG